MVQCNCPNGTRRVGRMNKEIQESMKDYDHLTDAYMIVKQTLMNEYGEAFTRLSQWEQARAIAKMLSEILAI